MLGDGSVVCARRDNQYSDLYHCLPWSHGSLAFLVSLTLEIVPVKPYIHMKYIPVRGQKNYCDMIRERHEQEVSLNWFFIIGCKLVP